MRSSNSRLGRDARGTAVVTIVVPVVVVALVVACGARGPLDDTPLDAGFDAAVTAEAEADTGGPLPSPPPRDAGREGGVLACGQCVVGQCSPDILECAQSPSCRATLGCVVTTCLGSGTPTPSCLLACASGNTDGVVQALAILQCVTNTCGPDCSSLLDTVLGNLPGGGGGGGRDGGARDAGVDAADAGDAGEDAEADP